MKWPFVLTLTWFQLYSLWYSYQPPESVGGFFYPTFFNIIHYCTQFEESACNPKKQLACCAFFWRSYAYTLVSELLLLLLRFRSWILRNTKTWALLCGKSHAEKKSPFVEEYYRRLWIWWWCDYLYWNTIISYKTPLLH